LIVEWLPVSDRPVPPDLAERHLPLVRSIAAKVRQGLPPQIELGDLVGYGTKGLMEAAERYDPGRGVAFSTFAYYRIRGAIYDGLRESGYLPRSVYARLRIAERMDDYLENQVERQAGAGPAARSRVTTADTLRELSGHLSGVTAIFVTSLDGLKNPEVEDQTAGQAFERLDVVGLGPHLRAGLAQLEERERRLIELCYYRDYSLRAAGIELGMSKSWASRLHARAITKLQQFRSERDAAIPAPAPGGLAADASEDPTHDPALE
jgi:RNA polymerase sigma factor for flagellar operon FliA